MWTNGKYQGDDGPQMAAPRAFADIPAMYVPRFSRALVVGLGTGVTVGALAAYPFEHIDLAELSPGIVRAAGTFFRATNGGVLDDPRLSLLHEDGRNVLLVAPDRYDLVTVELTSTCSRRRSEPLQPRVLRARGDPPHPGRHPLPVDPAPPHHDARDRVADRHRAGGAPPRGLLRARRPGRPWSRASRRRAAPRAEGRPARPGLRRGGPRAPSSKDACAEAGTTPEGVLSTDDNLRLEYATPRNNVPGRLTIAETTQAPPARSGRGGALRAEGVPVNVPGSVKRRHSMCTSTLGASASFWSLL